MTVSFRIVQDTRDLEKFKKEIKGDHFVKVGILSNKASRTEGEDINNPEVGAKNEFGFITDDGNVVPPRSFLQMPLEKKSKDIANFMGSEKVAMPLFEGKTKKSLKLVGVFCENIIQKAFTTSGFGTWAPNAERTIAEKGSDRPLIDTRQLSRSISSEVLK